jgi:threonine/homoserine/homoserine lactone efflux protein
VTFPLAFAIGFSVASIPGPTIVLIATESLTKGARAGVATMAAPLLLDAFLMLPLGLALQGLFTSTGAKSLGLIGGGLLAWLGFNSMRAGKAALRPRALSQHRPLSETKDIPSFFKGVLTHVSSPFPYLYWTTVGASFIRQGFARDGFSGALLFPLGFWLGASAFTLLIIFVAAQGKRLLPPRLEPSLYSLSGLLLVGSGILLMLQTWWDSPR